MGWWVTMRGRKSAIRHDRLWALVCWWGSGSGGVVDDAFDLAAVDAEVAGYGALAAACSVPGPYRLLHRWRASWHERCIVHRCRRSPVRMTRGDGSCLRLWPRSDEGHEEFEGAGQGQRGPGTDQCADGAVAEAVCQVGTDGGGDTGAQAPACQGGYGRRMIRDDS